VGLKSLKSLNLTNSYPNNNKNNNNNNNNKVKSKPFEFVGKKSFQLELKILLIFQRLTCVPWELPGQDSRGKYLTKAFQNYCCCCFCVVAHQL
jgi:hypothetical protein